VLDLPREELLDRDALVVLLAAFVEALAVLVGDDEVVLVDAEPRLTRLATVADCAAVSSSAPAMRSATDAVAGFSFAPSSGEPDDGRRAHARRDDEVELFEHLLHLLPLALAGALGTLLGAVEDGGDAAVGQDALERLVPARRRRTRPM
jgi:hypothetical protein